jgi:hypothetical protein
LARAFINADRFPKFLDHLSARLSLKPNSCHSESDLKCEAKNKAKLAQSGAGGSVFLKLRVIVANVMQKPRLAP